MAPRALPERCVLSLKTQYLAMIIAMIVCLLLCSVTSAPPTTESPTSRDPHSPIADSVKLAASANTNTQENELTYWRTQAIGTLEAKVKQQLNTGVAKNVILFLGDGMSVTTLTAARIYLGQLTNQTGEESRLSFEHFPYSGFSKTYCVNQQVGDSACTSTAYLGGVKANAGTLGVTAAVSRGNCDLSTDSTYHVDTILSWAQDAGKATGLVTTTRITHASPAGNYAHAPERNWEGDSDMSGNSGNCKDIAYQLINNSPGKNCKVLMGGGRSRFLPQSQGGDGSRKDNLSLIMDWQTDKLNQGTARYVSSKTELLNLDLNSTDYLLGLFQKEHMLYYLEDGSDNQPTLEEMTRAAIEILSKESNGFYLFVEGGRIDQAHHSNYARRALAETVEFHKAVQAAVELTDEEETLIVVTADHAHTMSMSGYPNRGDDILGAGLSSNVDHLAYTTLNYANGPSGESNINGSRHDISQDNIKDPAYQFPSQIPLRDETHGGDDVAVYARGPWAHLLAGNYEQNLIPHVMAHAARIGPLATRSLDPSSNSSNSSSSSSSSSSSLHPVTAAILAAVYALLSFVR